MRRKSASPEQAGIRDLTLDGRGVAATEGKAVFVDGAITGEVVRFLRRKRRKNYDEAELVEVLETVPTRAEPRCAVFGVCGGCTLQHLDQDAQLQLKHDALVQSLARIGDVAAGEWLPPLSGPRFGYRRRARLGARHVDKKGRVLVGFREKRKPYIADMSYCETLTPELAGLIAPLAELIAGLSICRSVPQIELSQGDEAVSLVFRLLEDADEHDLARLRNFAVSHGVQAWLQTGGPGTVRPLEPAAPPPLWYGLPEFDLRLEFGPQDFVQVNQSVNRLMLVRAMELLQPQPGERFLDLFCGIGNFSLPLARLGGEVLGVELEADMVAKARHNARLNALQGTEFTAADLSAPETVPDWGSGFDAVVLDPPRAGAAAALPAIASTGARRLLYVSCHPGSLARDAGELVRRYGYRLSHAGAMDMFPQTGHVEAMALFVKGD